MSFRREDEALIGRLEDEIILERLFQHHAPGAEARLPPRASGLIASARALPGGEAAARDALDGDLSSLTRLLEHGPLVGKPAPLVHHVAVYYTKVGDALERAAPESAANAWVRAVAAFLALAEERAYLSKLHEAVLRGREVSLDRGALELVGDLGARAEAASRDLGASGRAALLALGWIDTAAEMAGVSAQAARRVKREAERRRDAALDSALAVVDEALEDASARGEPAAAGRERLARAVDVWAWSSRDEVVERFAVDKLASLGWDLYRERSWGALRALLEPFRPLIDHLAERIERDPSKIAYAAPCAQMYVFLSDVDPVPSRRLELAERAVQLCPTHRNGRLVLASLLCDQIITLTRAMVLFARREDVERCEAWLARAEALYPTARRLPEAKAALDRVKSGRIQLPRL